MTTLRRLYNTPNCNLVLEGLSNDVTSDPQAIMSILVNAECHTVGANKVLTGGRTFFDSLVKTLNAYAQEYLSGLHHLQEDGRVHLEKVHNSNLHRLTVEPEQDTNDPPIQIELNTVELFDLVEAIDRFLSDRTTLPDLTVDLQPLSKRYRQSEEPIIERATPVALGLTSLALSGLALFLIPVPETRKPENNLQPNNSNTNVPVNNATPGTQVPTTQPTAPINTVSPTPQSQATTKPITASTSSPQENKNNPKPTPRN
jgi:hypothetical protein